MEEGDVRRSRILMREPRYRALAPRLYWSVEALKVQDETSSATVVANFRGPSPSQWEPASLLLPELKKRHELAIGPLDT